MAFFEVEFPRTIGYRAMGGPGFSTIVNQSFSGQEYRNRNWSSSRGKWTIDLKTPAGVSRQDFIDLLLAFFLAVGGRADGFRLKDHKDYKCTGQTLASLGSNHYQLQRSYTIGGRTYVRTITKPVWSSVNDYQGNALSNTVVLKSSGSALTYGADWTIDATTGIVTTTHGTLTADFEYHFPVRFDTDEIPLTVEESNISAGQGIVSLTGVKLVEVLPPNY